MAGKRTATSELNHLNWQDEDEREDAGSFTKAPEEIVKNRVIKIAKRRNPIGGLASTDEEKKNTFAKFIGFDKPTSSSSSATFSFLSNLTNKTEEQPKSNGLNDTTINTTKSNTSTKTVKEADLEKSGKPKEYYAKIKGLNQSVSKWIQTHVDKNPFLNLSPIFRDYEKYLEDIESLQVFNEHNKVREIKSVTMTTLKATEETTPSKSMFSFSKSKDEVVPEQKPQFTFGSNNSSLNKFVFDKTETNTTGFSFGTSTAPKQFTFSNVSTPEKNTEVNKDEEDEDPPPKVEFTPIVEEGSVYTIRCKVFVKKNDSLVIGELEIYFLSQSQTVTNFN
ncbi:hypothetical protein FQR65_LT02903 [Abscondita terminalis]|nr:hypothetical protein FQR65_LT02903 [Abscondita terminalis]